MAGKLFTFFVSYEFLTLSTYPLVLHRCSPSVWRSCPGGASGGLGASFCSGTRLA